MPLPEDVHRRLVARAVTDPDLASLLAIFTKPAETVSESPIDAGIVRFHLTGITSNVSNFCAKCSTITSAECTSTTPRTPRSMREAETTA